MTTQKRTAPLTGTASGPRIHPDSPAAPRVVAIDRERKRIKRLLGVLGTAASWERGETAAFERCRPGEDDRDVDRALILLLTLVFG